MQAGFAFALALVCGDRMRTSLILTLICAALFAGAAGAMAKPLEQVQPGAPVDHAAVDVLAGRYTFGVAGVHQAQHALVIDGESSFCAELDGDATISVVDRPDAANEWRSFS